MRCVPRMISGLLTAAILTLAAPVNGQEAEDQSRELRSARDTKWEFFVGPYGWLTGVEGTVVSNGESVDIDIPFDQFLENLQAGIMLYFEARKDRVFIAFDGTWARLGTEIEGNLLDLDVEILQRIYDIRVGLEVVNKELGTVIERKNFDWQRRVIVDFFFGGRYFKTEAIVTLVPIIGAEREIGIKDSRIDPFIGLRIGWDMNYRWSFGFRGDVGGFGIMDGAQFSWQAAASFGYRVSGRVAVIGGYRVLDYDTITGEGDNRNGNHLRQSGPIIGAGISF